MLFAAKSRGPKATALSYTYTYSKRNVKLVLFEMRQQNFVVC